MNAGDISAAIEALRAEVAHERSERLALQQMLLGRAEEVRVTIETLKLQDDFAIKRLEEVAANKDGVDRGFVEAAMAIAMKSVVDTVQTIQRSTNEVILRVDGMIDRHTTLLAEHTSTLGDLLERVEELEDDHIAEPRPRRPAAVPAGDTVHELCQVVSDGFSLIVRSIRSGNLPVECAAEVKHRIEDLTRRVAVKRSR